MARRCHHLLRLSLAESVEGARLRVRGLANIRRIREGHDMAQLAEDFKIIDADTHYTEPYDLWTSRAPKGYENRVLHMEERDGLATWVVDGNEIGFARGGGVVARDSSKLPFLDALERGLDWVHEGAFDPQARLRLMDECGVHAQ